MRKLLPAIFIVLALSAFAAEGHAFAMSVPEKTVNVPTLGSRDVIITLVGNASELVNVNLIEARTWMSLSENLVRLNAGEKKEVVLTVSPFQDTVTGLYKVTVIAESLTTKQKSRRDVFISVYKGEVVDIEKIVVAGDPKPTGDISITIFVKNYKTVPSGEVIVDADVSGPTRKVFEFTEIVENINPDQRVSRARNFTIPKYAEAGTYKASATLLVGNESLSVVQTFTVASKPVIVITEEKTPLLFGFRKRITVTNNGNEAAPVVTVAEPVSAVEAVFFSGDAPTSTQGGYAWLLKDVAPGQVIAVDYKVDYAPLFAFLAALIIAGWVIFYKLRTVRIKKYIIQKKELEEGEEFTVGIEVRNASGRKMDEIVVKDFVPPVFELRSAQAPEPSRKKTAAGAELTWKLMDVHNREERLVSYRIVPLFGVHGQIRLPRASAGFRQNKRHLTNRSKFAVIGVETEPQERGSR